MCALWIMLFLTLKHAIFRAYSNQSLLCIFFEANRLTLSIKSIFQLFREATQAKAAYNNRVISWWRTRREVIQLLTSQQKARKIFLSYFIAQNVNQSLVIHNLGFIKTLKGNISRYPVSTCIIANSCVWQESVPSYKGCEAVKRPTYG